jgi:DNA-binding beta-propeller fold protein YncE
MTSMLRFLLACLTCALVGCAAPPKIVVSEAPPVFPPPPGEPRVIFERTFYGSGDLAKSGQSSLLTFLTGTKNGPGEVEGMARPQALAVYRGRVFVANAQDRPISVFDLPRKRFYRIGEEGSAGALQMPAGLSVDRVGNLFVADSAKNAILVYDAEGKYLRRIGGPESFSHLTNVTVDKQGERVYAIDVGDAGHRVRVFDARDGRHLFEIGRAHV